jgi:hypothetical protein
MAGDKCVAAKCEVKKIFDKDLTKPVCDQMKDTIETLVNKTKGLVFDKNCKDGWLLTATVVSLDVDDPAKPTSMEAKIQIDGVAFNQSASSLKATGNAKMKGVRPKKIEDDATTLVNDVIDDLMQNRVIPAITK